MAATLTAGASAPTLPGSLSGISGERSSRISAPIIVATDGTDASEAGVAAARTLARSLNAPVQLVSVIPPLHSLLPSAEGFPVPSVEDRSGADARLEAIRQQQQKLAPGEAWTTEIKFGDPATVLTRLAKTRRARVLVMGRRPHGKMDQLLGDDTVFDVMRLAETPVLVVTEPMARPPKILTIAVDFSDLSMSAARGALDISPEAGLVYLVHVQPGGQGMEELAGRYGVDAKEAFAQLVEELDSHTSARIDTVELSGTPARELVDFAATSRSELLVVGSYSRGLFRRLVGGAMASRLMRAAPCPVLIVPQAASDDEIEEAAAPEGSGNLPDQAITAMLDELTRRNAGRRVMFETDNGFTGTQLLAFDYTFLVAEYDAIGERVHIALTDSAERPCNSVTHSMCRPGDIDVRRAVDGMDHTVRLSGSCGHMSLTFW